MRVWRETMAQKYSNLPGIQGLHDFVGMHNSGQSSTMKAAILAHSRTHQRRSQKKKSALPGVGQTYLALGMVKQLSESKQGQLNQMCQVYSTG